MSTVTKVGEALLKIIDDLNDEVESQEKILTNLRIKITKLEDEKIRNDTLNIAKYV